MKVDPESGFILREKAPPVEAPTSIAEMLGADGSGIAVTTFDDFEGCGRRFLGRVIALRSLSGEEIQRCYAEALAWLLAPAPKGCGWSDAQLYTELGEAARDYEVKVRHVARAWVRAHDTSQPQDTVDNVRKMLEPDELTGLYERFLDWQSKRSALTRITSAQELEDTADALLKGLMPPTWAMRCAHSTLRDIVPALVAAAHRQTRRHSSDTSPPTESLNDSPSPTT